MWKWIKRSVRKLAAAVGVVILSRKHYESLVFDNALAQHVKPKVAFQPFAKISQTHTNSASSGGGVHPSIPLIAFPYLPGTDSDIFRVNIVDVGAQPLEDEEDIYAPLLRAGPCHVVGFDPFANPDFEIPQETSQHKPHRRDDTHVHILPYFIGNGERAKFRINSYSPTSSLFSSNVRLVDEYSGLAEICRTKSVVEVSTTRLDDVSEIESCDFLKVDVQGGDFDVVAHGARILDKALFVHIESEFAQIYEKQPLFSDIDALLRIRRFEFLDFMNFGWNNYKALPSSLLRSRLLWADCIYMKNPEYVSSQNPRLLIRAAYIAHVVYQKYDLAAHLIKLYDRATQSSLHSIYCAAIIRAVAEIN